MSENLVPVPTELAAALSAETALLPPEPQEPTVNTPETLGVTPRYVLQHNAISRSIQNLSPTAKKLTAMAMALIPSDLSNLTAAFTFPEFCKALGMPIGGEQYKIFKEAVNECMQCVITIETEPNAKGKKKWKKFTWFIAAQYNEETSKATMTFSPILAEVLLDLKRAYAKIDLQDMGKLQSKYALRYLELAKSYSYLQGHDGNQDNMWYFVYAVEELRLMLSVPDGSYHEKRDLRKYVVEKPLKELNQAGIGLEVTTESIKQGRNLSGIKFNCKKVAKKVSVKGKGRKKTSADQLELVDPNPKTADQREEKENQHLKELYPDEFAGLYASELERTPHFLKGGGLSKIAAESEALIKLREKHGIVK
ncbi:MAG: replication initiation protein [Treponema sp.]|nr:replication initiation protein [Treponema sp.]